MHKTPRSPSPPTSKQDVTSHEPHASTNASPAVDRSHQVTSISLKLITALLLMLTALSGYALWSANTSHLEVMRSTPSGSLDELEQRAHGHDIYASRWGEWSPQRVKAQRRSIYAQAQSLSRRQTLKLLKILYQRPALPPARWSEAQGEVKRLRDDIKRLDLLLSGPAFVDLDSERAQSERAALKATIAHLTSWSAIVEQVKEREHHRLSDVLRASLEETRELSQIQTQAQPQETYTSTRLTQASSRYMFWWHREWAQRALDELKREVSEPLMTRAASASDLVSLERALSARATDLERALTLASLISLRAPDLAGFMTLAYTRLIEDQWRSIWGAYERSLIGRSTQAKLKALAHFLKLATRIMSRIRALHAPRDTASLHPSADQLIKRAVMIKLPSDVLRSWRLHLETLPTDDIAMLIADPSAPTSALKTTKLTSRLEDAWFYGALTSTQRTGVLHELQLSELGQELSPLLASAQLSLAQLQRLEALLKELSGLSPRGRALADELSAFIQPQWRSFSGEVSCREGDPALGQWRDVMFDKLSPYLILKSDTDQARLHGREGRLRWGLRARDSALVQVWDRDRVGGDDLISQASFPSLLQLINGEAFESNGCRWSVSMKSSTALVSWLGSRALPSIKRDER